MSCVQFVVSKHRAYHLNLSAWQITSSFLWMFVVFMDVCVLFFSDYLVIINVFVIVCLCSYKCVFQFVHACLHSKQMSMNGYTSKHIIILVWNIYNVAIALSTLALHCRRWSSSHTCWALVLPTRWRGKPMGLASSTIRSWPRNWLMFLSHP